MSKFIKRIQKTVKKTLDNVIVIGSDEKNVENIIGGFKTVFFVNHRGTLPKYKNVIPIQDTNFLNELQTIDIIFLNTNYDAGVFQFIPSIVRKSAPVIFLHKDLVLSTEYIDFFRRIRYEQLSVLDDYQVWKIIRK